MVAMHRSIFAFLLILTGVVPALGNPVPAPAGKSRQENIPLHISDAIKISVEKNLSLQLESLEPKIKKTDIEIGEAEFDPALSAGVFGSKQRRPFASAFAKPDVGDTLQQDWDLGIAQKLKLGTEYDLTLKSKMQDTNSVFTGLDPQFNADLTLNFTQPLLKGLGTDVNTANILVAKNNQDISDFRFKEKMIEIIARVQNAYWDLTFARENLKVQHKALRLAKDFERQIRAQVKVGAMAPIEILQAQAEFAAREEDTIVASNEVEKASDNLKEIMNVSDDLYHWGGLIEPLDPPSFVLEHFNRDEKISRALENRPDIQEAKKAIESEDILLKYHENQRYPTLDLVGSLALNGMSGTAKIFGLAPDTSKSRFGGGYGKQFDRLFSTDFFSWRIGVNIKYPLGNRKAENELTASKFRKQKLLLQLKDLEKKAVLEVRNGLREIATNVKRVESTRVASELASEKLRAEEKKYRAGLSTSFNVLTFQRDLAAQETKSIKAIIDYDRSLVNLHQVVAETLEVHGIQVQPQGNTP